MENNNKEIKNLYPTLKTIGETEINNNRTAELEQISTLEGLNKYTSWAHVTYKGTFEQQTKKAQNKINNEANKRILALNNRLNLISNTEDFKEDLIITIEYKKSSMWGVNPTSQTNFGFCSGSIGGCGYDKQSTATARALNSHLQIIKLMYAKKEAILKEHTGEILKRQYYDDNKPVYVEKVKGEHDLTREYLGYGSGYNILPSFEGGVGVSCHKTILERLGLKMEQISDAKHTDVYRIYKKEVPQ
jgi:hypothetical protein